MFALHIVGGLALATLIAVGGGVTARKVVDGVAARIPQRTRTRARNAGRKATKRVAESGRQIRQKAMADARATNWLERKRENRARRASRPPRHVTAARMAGNAVKRAGVLAGRFPHPKVAIMLPAVASQTSTAPAQQPPTPARPPAPATDVRPTPPPPAPATITKVTTTGRPATMPQLTRPGVPPDYAALNARVANYEPESDADLIAFMRGVAAGMLGQGEALDQLAEHLVAGLGLDPAAVQGITEYAQAVTQCAEIMARANARFQSVYQGVRETVANGTVLPHHGRWITGESA